MLFHPLDNGSLNDLKTALTFLSEQSGVDEEKVGAIGFCIGGSFAISWACTDDRLKAIAPFYSTNPPLEAVECVYPVVGSYPGKDFTASKREKLDTVLSKQNTPHDIKL